MQQKQYRNIQMESKILLNMPYNFIIPLYTGYVKNHHLKRKNLMRNMICCHL